MFMYSNSEFISWPLWYLQLFHNVLTPPGGIMKLPFLSISKYRHWNLSKSQNVPEGISSSTEESNNLASLTSNTFIDKWLFKRWIQTRQHFCIHFPTTIIKRDYIFLNCQLSGCGMPIFSGCFIGDIWYIFLKYSQNFFLILLQFQFWLSLIYNKMLSFKKEKGLPSVMWKAEWCQDCLIWRGFCIFCSWYGFYNYMVP